MYDGDEDGDSDRDDDADDADEDDDADDDDDDDVDDDRALHASVVTLRRSKAQALRAADTALCGEGR